MASKRGKAERDVNRISTRRRLEGFKTPDGKSIVFFENTYGYPLSAKSPGTRQRIRRKLRRQGKRD